jgi:hypothetical protein
LILLAFTKSGAIEWTLFQEQLWSIFVHHILDEREAAMRCSILKWAIWFVAPACIATVCTAGIVRAQQKSNPPAAPAAQPAAGEAAAKAPSAAIVIADEPKAIDPATLVPEKLAAKATVQFKETSLTDVVKWIREELKIGVTLDAKALADENILLSEPVTDRLNDEPLYLLLDRLRALGLGWYLEGGVLHITTITDTADHMATVPYNLGDLLDAGYDGPRIDDTITKIAEPASWDGNGGQGSVVLLGDVLFVRNTAPVQRLVAGLLAALRKHGRQTLIADPPQHALLRKKLEENVTVNFKDAPLADAVGQIARKAQADIRLDHAGLKTAGLRERIPVSLDLADQKLKVVLGALLNQHNLTWILRDGALWITSQEEAGATTSSAVYDVRDLCRDQGESNALEGAIESQAKGPWDSNGGNGSIDFVRPGVMVVSSTEDQLAAVLTLLENYRTALRASKPRKHRGADPKEVITHYYRVQTPIAEDLAKFLPQLVRPETWKSAEKPDATGTIVVVASTVDLRDAQGHDVVAEKTAENSKHVLAVHNSVLIIRQMREVHDQVTELIQNVERGDTSGGGAFSGMGGGLGGGGFGGGFFGVSSQTVAPAQPQKPMPSRRPRKEASPDKKLPRKDVPSQGGRFEKGGRFGT